MFLLYININDILIYQYLSIYSLNNIDIRL